MIDFDAVVNGAITGVFGEALSYTHRASGTIDAVQAPFSEPYTHQVLADDGSAVWTVAAPSFACRLSALSAVPVRGDSVLREKTGAAYLVYDSIPDGVGWTKILLKVLE